MTNTRSIGDLRTEMASLLVHAGDLLGDLEPADLPTSLVPALMEQFVALERLGGAGRVLLAAKAVESERWKREGFGSATDSWESTGCSGVGMLGWSWLAGEHLHRPRRLISEARACPGRLVGAI